MTSGPPPGTPMPPPMPPPFDAPMPPVPATGNPPQNGIGTAALVMGILQFVCLGPIGTVLAIIFGRMGMKRVERGEADNGGLAKAGFWLGIVGLILSVIAVIVVVATGATVFKFAQETVKSVNESTDPAKNSQTGLADGDYQMTPSSTAQMNDSCGFEGPAVAVGTGETTSPKVLVVGQGVSDCSTSVSVDFTVTGGVASITSTSSGGTQTGQAATPTQGSPAGAIPAITDPAFIALGDLSGDWTGTGTDGAEITLTVSNPDQLNGTIAFDYPSGTCVESWTQAGTDSGAVLIDQKPLPASTLDMCTSTQYRVTVDGAGLAAEMASGDYTMVLTR